MGLVFSFPALVYGLCGTVGETIRLVSDQVVIKDSIATVTPILSGLTVPLWSIGYIWAAVLVSVLAVSAKESFQQSVLLT